MPKDNPAAHRSMTPPAVEVTEDGFYCRYLAAKKGIDDRALNRQVWEHLCLALPEATAGEAGRILEIGAGIGTMIERAVDWGLVSGQATYVASDRAVGHLRAARQRLAQWAARQGHTLSWLEGGRGRLRTSGAELTLEFAVASAEELACGINAAPPFHLLIAHAVLDLVDFGQVLPPLLARLSKNGLAYLTCNFDGETVFLPGYQGPEEEEILRRYHASMEARLAGSSHSGRRLLAFLQQAGLEILAAGSSDWIVHPRAGRYSADEAFFLHAIIDTVQGELAKEKDQAPPGLAAWARVRHRQVERGELIFLARHLDLLVRRPQNLP